MKSRMDRIIDWVKACDTKASIMIALVGVLVSLISTSDFVLNRVHVIVNSVKEYNFHEKSIHDVKVFGVLTILFLLVSLYYLIGSMYRFVLVVYSKHQETLSDTSNKTWVFTVLDFIFHHKQNELNGSHLKTDSLISLNHIAKMEYDEFKAAVHSSFDEEDYLSQIYINARRCREKFEDYNSAIRWMLYAMPFMILFFLSLLLY